MSNTKNSIVTTYPGVSHLEIRVRVWMKSGEKQNPCWKSSVKFPQSVMIWTAMSSAGVGPLCFLKSTVNAAIYQEILEHFMLLLTSFMEMLISFSSRTWYLPTLKRYQKNMALLCLIAIENLWGIVKRKMRDNRPNNADDLKAAIKPTWASLHPSSATNWSPPCHAALMHNSCKRRPNQVLSA